MTKLWQEVDLFNNCNWKDPGNGLMYRKMMDKDRIYDFLARLNKDLDEVRGRIIGMKPLSQNKKVFF